MTPRAVFAAFVVPLFCCLLLASAAAANEDSPPPKVTLDNTEHRQLTSSINGETYQIYVKLPRDYGTSGKRYPVLYVTDAETNFGGTGYIVQRLMKDHLVPDMIVVGVAYGSSYDAFYQLRARDLTPVPVDGWRNSGGAEAFRKFMLTDLFPFVGEHYRVTDDRAYYGHSFGGLFGFHVLLTAPEMFDRYLLLSPSLWWADRTIFESATAASGTTSAARVYVGIGELESSHMVSDHLAMVNLLDSVEGSRLTVKSEILPDETHRTVFGTGFTRGLRFLYADARPESATRH